MRTFLTLGLIAIGAAGSASQPVGSSYGRWHVVSISSLSGTAGDDASVILVQGDEPDTFQAQWTQGGPVVVSLHIEKCSGDYDFDASYSVELARWLRLSRGAMQSRLRSDFVAWLDQARLACGPTPKITAFETGRLDRAASEFGDRLRRFAAVNPP